MWTINDFLVYKIVFSWSMHEKLACHTVWKLTMSSP